MKDNVSSNVKLHRFMVTFMATFKATNGASGSKYINTTISRGLNSLPLVFIRNSQESVAMQLQYFGVQPDDIYDIAFVSSSYLGHMTETEFTAGLTEDQAKSTNLQQMVDNVSTDATKAPRRKNFDA